MLVRRYPGGVGNSPLHALKLVLFSEGFAAGQAPQFGAVCSELLQRLLNTSPFNLTRINPAWITVHTRFLDESLGSEVDAAGRLSVDPRRVKTVVDAEQLRVAGEPQSLSTLVSLGQPTYGRTGTLTAVLLPPLAGRPEGADMEHIPAADEVHFVATTCDGEWHQVVLRGLCKVLGLGDEYDLPGPEHLAPTDLRTQFVPYFNLHWSANPPTTNGANPAWRSLFGPSAIDQPAVVHRRAPGAPDPDRELPGVPATADATEYWEGGVGFRTGVYRSAADCLMRRRPGDPTLPLRRTVVPLCPACHRYVSAAIR